MNAAEHGVLFLETIVNGSSGTEHHKGNDDCFVFGICLALSFVFFRLLMPADLLYIAGT